MNRIEIIEDAFIGIKDEVADHGVFTQDQVLLLHNMLTRLEALMVRVVP